MAQFKFMKHFHNKFGEKGRREGWFQELADFVAGISSIDSLQLKSPNRRMSEAYPMEHHYWSTKSNSHGLSRPTLDDLHATTIIEKPQVPKLSLMGVPNRQFFARPAVAAILE